MLSIFKKYKVCIFIGLFAHIVPLLCVKSAITYEVVHGRYGDHLFHLGRAAYIAYTYGGFDDDDHGIVLAYTPFLYSDCLHLHTALSCKRSDFKKRVTIEPGQQLQSVPDLLYICPAHYVIKIDWSDEQFMAILRDLIRPVVPLDLVDIPEGVISVAVHVRKGGGYDGRSEIAKRPQLFMSDSYYIEQIQYIANIFPEDTIYVHIFTDDKRPERLVRLYKQKVDNQRVVFNCRKTKNQHDLNVLEDFFSMTRFNCIIRSASHFSLWAERIGDHLVAIKPEYKWHGRQGKVTGVIIDHKEDGKKKRTRKNIASFSGKHRA